MQSRGDGDPQRCGALRWSGLLTKGILEMARIAFFEIVILELLMGLAKRYNLQIGVGRIFRRETPKVLLTS
jgi:hypothetical protein